MPLLGTNTPRMLSARPAHLAASYEADPCCTRPALSFGNGAMSAASIGGAVWVRAHAQLAAIATASVCDTPRAAIACPALTAAVMQCIAPRRAFPLLSTCGQNHTLAGKCFCACADPGGFSGSLTP